MGRIISLSVVLMLLVAGCAGTSANPTDTSTEQPPTITASAPTATAPATTTMSTSSPTASPTPTSSATPTPSPTPSPTPTPTATPTPTPTPTPLPPQNPWRKEVVTVGINNSADADRDFEPFVREAIAYWNGDGSQYTTYPITFGFAPDAQNPEIEVRSVEEIQTCGLHFDSVYVGCASLLSADSQPADLEVVKVRADMNDNSTRDVLKHEFGHLLGIQHDEPPYAIMTPIEDVTYLDKPNARERENPWEKNEITVAYNLSGVKSWNEAETREQLGHALDYYNEGADGYTPANVTFRLIDDEARADIWIYVEDGGEFTSSGQGYGQDIDEDDRLEYFTSYDIVLRDVDTDRIGWHAGYWVGGTLGANSTDELPPPFDEPQKDDRENWWR